MQSHDTDGVHMHTRGPQGMSKAHARGLLGSLLFNLQCHMWRLFCPLTFLKPSASPMLSSDIFPCLLTPNLCPRLIKERHKGHRHRDRIKTTRDSTGCIGRPWCAQKGEETPKNQDEAPIY